VLPSLLLSYIVIGAWGAASTAAAAVADVVWQMCRFLIVLRYLTAWLLQNGAYMSIYVY